MDAEDGDLFVKCLASFIRSHEKALAESHHYVRQRPVTAPSLSSSSSSSLAQPSSATASALYSTINFSTLGLASPSPKPARLFLTPNQLYYLLSRFEDLLGVDTGPANVRLENIHAESASSNYVSFLQQIPSASYKNRRGSDQISIQSVSSVRSVMSSMWSSLGASVTGGLEARKAKQLAAAQEDLRYLYSAFTKIPHLKLAMDPRIRRIAGYEEFPFDTAVPLWVFKNICDLEIIDVDYRSFYGWDRLADQLRSLTLKRAGLEDVRCLLANIVLDDMDKRRRRSSKNTASPIAYPSPSVKHAELARSNTSPATPSLRSRPATGELSKSLDWGRPAMSSARSTPRLDRSQWPDSAERYPERHPMRRRDSNHVPRIKTTQSSSESSPDNTPRTSCSHLPGFGLLPHGKWQFLRHLGLPENGLTHLSADGFAPVMTTLTSLDLSGNLFTEIPDALSSLVSLRYLNLSNCMIDSLRSLGKTPLPAITVLALRSNRIRSLAGIESLVSLERLDLRDNQLTDPAEMARLTGMPEFRDLYVAKNPFTHAFDNHRIRIFNLFRAVSYHSHDICIDSAGPSFHEKRQLNDRATERFDQRDQHVTRQEVVVVPMTKAEAASKKQQEAAPAAAAPRTEKSEIREHPSKDRTKESKPKPPAETALPRAKPLVPSKAATAAATASLTHAAQPNKMVACEPDQDSTSARSKVSVPEPTGASSAAPAAQPGREKHTPPHMRTGTGLVNSDAPSFSESSQMYRKRIEDLKQSFGSDWLKMLGESTSPLSPRSLAPSVSPDSLSPRIMAQLASPVVVSSGQGLD